MFSLKKSCLKTRKTCYFTSKHQNRIFIAALASQIEIWSAHTLQPKLDKGVVIAKILKGHNMH